MARGVAWPAALLACMLLAGCASGVCRVRLATVVKVAVPGGRVMLAPALLAGRPLTLIVDTGAGMSLLSRASARDVAFNGSQAVLRGIGGSAFANGAVLNGLHLGRLQGTADVMVADRRFAPGGMPVDGLLGMTVLGAYDIDLDVPDQQLRLYATEGDCSQPQVLLGGSLYGVAQAARGQNRLQAEVPVQIGGTRVRAVIDSGAEVTTLFRPAARRLGLDADALRADRSGLMSGVGERRTVAHRHVLDAVTIGDLTLHRMPVAVVEQSLDNGVDMLLGMDFLRLVHVWISSSSGTVVMQYPPLPSPLLPASLGGTDGRAGAATAPAPAAPASSAGPAQAE